MSAGRNICLMGCIYVGVFILAIWGIVLLKTGGMKVVDPDVPATTSIESFSTEGGPVNLPHPSSSSSFSRSPSSSTPGPVPEVPA